MKQKNLLLLIALFGIVACGTDEQAEAQMQQAAAIHAESVELEQEIKPQLETLVQAKNSINVQGRALTPKEQLFVKKVEQLEQTYHFWEDNHIGVPGYESEHEHEHEHDHDHNHDHDHDHGASIELSPQDMLLIQQEFKDTLVALQQGIQTIAMPEDIVE